MEKTNNTPSQITNQVVMIRPWSFRMNEETAVNNYFQKQEDILPETIIQRAQREFDALVAKLRAVGIEVLVIEEGEGKNTPDALFPNNWISFHLNGTVALFPMYAENRRKERREDVLELLESQGYYIENIQDYTSAEEEEVFLEGTGSLLLDRVNKLAYCALSERAHEELLIEFCEDFDYLPIPFGAFQSVGSERLPIYHTNVMMCLGEDFAVICLECIDDKKERKHVRQQLLESGKDVISLTQSQIHQFAGNMLQLKGKDEKRILVMSSSAYRSLRPDQLKALEKYTEILHSSLDTIETLGGGSARCMLAKSFCPRALKAKIFSVIASGRRRSLPPSTGRREAK